MRSRTLHRATKTVLVSTALPVVLLCASALGQAAPVDARYTGTYVYAGTVEAAHAQFRRVLEPELRRFDPLTRMMAENLVGNVLPFPRRIQIRIDGDRIWTRIEQDSQEPREYASRAGYPSHREHDGRRTSTLTQLFRDGKLEQIVEYRGGVRRYRIFELDASGERLRFDLAFVTAGQSHRFTAPCRRARP